jgi:hypothetical protein
MLLYGEREGGWRQILSVVGRAGSLMCDLFPHPLPVDAPPALVDAVCRRA